MTNRKNLKQKNKNNQQQDSSRVEFGREIDVNFVKEQSKRNTKQKNVTLDPRDNR